MKLVSIHIHIKLLAVFITLLATASAQTWSLQQCIDTAKTNNMNLKMSRNNIEIGNQKHKEAIANLIPKLTANGDYKYFIDLPYQLLPMSVFNGPQHVFKEAQFGVPHNLSANIQLAMPLYNSQIYGAVEATKIGEEINALQFEKTEEQIFFEISNLYYNAQILSNQLSFIDSNLANAKKLLSSIQLLNEQLLAKGTDVGKVKLQVEQLNTQQSLVSSKLSQVINALKFTMGISIDRNLEIEKEIKYTSGNEYSPAPPIDVRLAKTQNRLFESELRTLKRSLLPSLTLFGSYGYTGFGYDVKPYDFLKFYPLSFGGIQLSYPLFNGTVTYRKIRQKKYALQNSELQVKLLAEQNNMQIENAKLQQSTTRKSIETILQQLQLAESVYQQTVLQQKQGTATLSDVLLADNALREVQQNYLNAVIDFLKSELEMKKLTGNFISNKKK